MKTLKERTEAAVARVLCEMTEESKNQIISEFTHPPHVSLRITPNILARVEQSLMGMQSLVLDNDYLFEEVMSTMLVSRECSDSTRLWAALQSLARQIVNENVAGEFYDSACLALLIRIGWETLPTQCVNCATVLEIRGWESANQSRLHFDAAATVLRLTDIRHRIINMCNCPVNISNIIDRNTTCETRSLSLIFDAIQSGDTSQDKEYRIARALEEFLNKPHDLTI